MKVEMSKYITDKNFWLNSSQFLFLFQNLPAAKSDFFLAE